jgi:branched-chain amino acid transport system ATP-binding protein
MTALRKVSLTVTQGTVIALIGANGVGKSTLLNSIVGLHTRTSGSVNLEGKPIRGKSAHEIARMGIGLVPEGRHLFPELTVSDNLRMGTHGLKVSNRETGSREDEVFELFPILGDFSNRLAGLLSGGQQQMLAIGRALVRHPRVLLLDEPSLGLAPLLVQQILQTVRALADRGVGILLAEQNAAAALRIADVGVVMENGRVTINQPAAELLADEDVSRHYLGVGGPHSTGHESSATELPVALRRSEL